MDIETMMAAVGQAIQRLEDNDDADVTAIRELALRVQVLEDRVAALAAHDAPSTPAAPAKRTVAFEADEQGYREGAYELEHYGWVL